MSQESFPCREKCPRSSHIEPQSFPTAPAPYSARIIRRWLPLVACRVTIWRVPALMEWRAPWCLDYHHTEMGFCHRTLLAIVSLPVVNCRRHLLVTSLVPWPGHTGTNTQGSELPRTRLNQSCTSAQPWSPDKYLFLCPPRICIYTTRTALCGVTTAAPIPFTFMRQLVGPTYHCPSLLDQLCEVSNLI